MRTWLAVGVLLASILAVGCGSQGSGPKKGAAEKSKQDPGATVENSSLQQGDASKPSGDGPTNANTNSKSDGSGETSNAAGSLLKVGPIDAEIAKKLSGLVVPADSTLVVRGRPYKTASFVTATFSTVPSVDLMLRHFAFQFDTLQTVQALGIPLEDLANITYVEGKSAGGSEEPLYGCVLNFTKSYRGSIISQLLSNPEPATHGEYSYLRFDEAGKPQACFGASPLLLVLGDEPMVKKLIDATADESPSFAKGAAQLLRSDLIVAGDARAIRSRMNHFVTQGLANLPAQSFIFLANIASAPGAELKLEFASEKEAEGARATAQELFAKWGAEWKAEDAKVKPKDEKDVTEPKWMLGALQRVQYRVDGSALLVTHQEQWRWRDAGTVLVKNSLDFARKVAVSDDMALPTLSRGRASNDDVALELRPIVAKEAGLPLDLYVAMTGEKDAKWQDAAEQTLTAVLSSDPIFRTPAEKLTPDQLANFRWLTPGGKPDIAAAVIAGSRSEELGWGSFVQAADIRDASASVIEDRAEGRVSFRYQNVYQGTFDYEIHRIHKQWVLKSISMPAYGLQCRLVDGHWKATLKPPVDKAVEEKKPEKKPPDKKPDEKKPDDKKPDEGKSDQKKSEEKKE